VKQKENIFEELNKMKRLIHTKAGVVISEQADIGYDIATIQSELDKVNSDEKKIVDIVKKYKDKASFKSFVDQYKAKSGKDFGEDIRRALFGGQDRVEIEDLKKHLSSLGVTLGDAPYVRGKLPSYIFGGLDTSVAAANDRQKNINAIFCSVKNGTITNPSSQFNNTPWESWKTTYKPTDAEIEVAKKSCKIGGVGNKSNDYARIVGDYSKKVQTSLGSSPTGQLSDNELEKILTQLNGEVSGEVNQTVQGLPTTADGQPDLEKILASL